jgi:hypothetical protein
LPASGGFSRHSNPSIPQTQLSYMVQFVAAQIPQKNRKNSPIPLIFRQTCAIFG